MFSVDDRERVRELLIEKARSDAPVVAAAAIGGSASGGDRWSDLDLTFGVADGVSVEAVMSDWTQALRGDFDAAVLFDCRDTALYAADTSPCLRKSLKYYAILCVAFLLLPLYEIGFHDGARGVGGEAEGLDLAGAEAGRDGALP